MPVITESNNLSDVLKWEQEKRYSREALTITMGEVLALGEVIGRKLLDIPATGTADGANTGNGTMTAVSGGAETQLGSYTFTCISASANAGVFAVMAPDGAALPDATVAVAYANAQINGTINDGATDFAVGDIFTVVVAKGDGSAVALDLTAVDGTQIAAGFVIAAYDATAAAVAGVSVVRDAVINPDNLVWPAGITADQTAAALDQLAGRGIVTREAA